VIECFVYFAAYSVAPHRKHDVEEHVWKTVQFLQLSFIYVICIIALDQNSVTELRL